MYVCLNYLPLASWMFHRRLNYCLNLFFFELRSKNLEISCILLTIILLKSQLKYVKISSNNFEINITKLI